MSGFFTFLWRVNAVLAFVALLAAIVFLTLFSKERIDRPVLNYFVPPPLVQTVKPIPTYTYVLEQDLMIGGSTASEAFDLYRLVRWGKIKGHPVTPEAAASVNLLVKDKKTNASKWLFKGFNRVIVGQEPLLTGRWYYREPEIDDDVPLHLLVLRVVEADSNGDGVFTADDRQSMYVARFEGAGEPEKVLSADQIWFTSQKGKEFLISYRDKGTAYFATYSLPEFKLLSQTPIEGMPN
jgi:hypothetical protein